MAPCQKMASQPVLKVQSGNPGRETGRDKDGFVAPGRRLATAPDSQPRLAGAEPRGLREKIRLPLKLLI